MATFVQRAKAIVDAAIDGTATQAQLQRVADAYTKEFPHFFTPINPLDPTQEEKAQCFVRAFRWWGRRVLRSAAQDQVMQQAEQDAQQAGKDAEGDL